MVNEDLLATISLLKDLRSRTDEVTTHFQGLAQKISAGELNTAKGLSFLEVKYHQLLSYLVNLTHLMCHKTGGGKIEGHESINRLVEIRTVLEKMRPIDQKLKYQLDKLLKTATTGSLAANDPLRFKPNPGNLVSKLEDEEEDEDSEDEDGEEKKGNKGVYRPPRLAPVHYDGDETPETRQERRLSVARKRALSSSIMKELREEHYQGPEEIRESTDFQRMREDREEKERIQYEEERFVRLPVPKRKKSATSKMTTINSLGRLTEFEDISALTHDDGDAWEGPAQKKRRKSAGKGKGKKGGKKKKRFK